MDEVLFWLVYLSLLCAGLFVCGSWFMYDSLVNRGVTEGAVGVLSWVMGGIIAVLLVDLWGLYIARGV